MLPVAQKSRRLARIAPAPTSPAAGRGNAVSGRKRMTAHAAATIREHQWFLILSIAFVGSGYLIEWLSGVNDMMDLNLYSITLIAMLAMYVAGFAALHACWFMVAVRPHGSLIRAWWRDLSSKYCTRWHLGRVLLVMAPLTPFMNTFSSFKRAIPAFVPFSWDVAFMEADRALHGGVHPWELLQPLVGFPIVTVLINAMYHLWIFVLFGVVIWQAWSSNRNLRTQFLLSFVMIWVLLGAGMATWLSSAGPCYYASVTDSASPYQGLMSYLHDVHRTHELPALNVQQMLWDSYQSGEVSMVKGISAMPSMHVSTAVLMALVAWRANRWLGIALTIFAVIIQIGSVHLAWHYAIDGYVSAVLTVAIWWLVGRVFCRQAVPAVDLDFARNRAAIRPVLERG
jgi:hypothetical protein